MDLLSRNVARNAAVFSGLELKSTVLDWFDDRLPEEILKHTNGVDNLPFDLIMFVHYHCIFLVLIYLENVGCNLQLGCL
jgi:hypothetical protein